MTRDDTVGVREPARAVAVARTRSRPRRRSRDCLRRDSAILAVVSRPDLIR